MARPDYVLGIDPGGRDTGYCLRAGSSGEVLDHGIESRGKDTRADYLARVLAAIVRIVDPDTIAVYEAGQLEPVHVTRTGHPPHQLDRGDLVIAVEDLVDPNPHLGTVTIAGIYDTAVTLGAILGTYPDAVLVRPGRHGSAPLAAYPPQLRGPRETRLNAIGTGRLRHARSAYDIAGVAGLYTDPPFGVLPRRPALMR